MELACAFQPASAWSVEAVERWLALPTTSAWIAGDPPVGYLLSAGVDDVAEVLTIGVLPGSRRSGVARSLLQTALGAWRAAGIGEVFLEVRGGNLPARSLYRSLGWEEVGLRRGYYADGADAVVMRLEPGI
jgi:ribosomal-protein-alanine N-acetyltransferase